MHSSSNPDTLSRHSPWTDELKGIYDSFCKTSISFQYTCNMMEGRGWWGGRGNRSEHGLELKRRVKYGLVLCFGFLFLPHPEQNHCCTWCWIRYQLPQCSWAGHSPWHLNLFIRYSGCYKFSSFWGEEGNDRNVLWKQLKVWSCVSDRVLSPACWVSEPNPHTSQEGQMATPGTPTEASLGSLKNAFLANSFAMN